MGVSFLFRAIVGVMGGSGRGIVVGGTHPNTKQMIVARKVHQKHQTNNDVKMSLYQSRFPIIEYPNFDRTLLPKVTSCC